MSLITQRPKNFNGVIGQDRALRVLRAILRSDNFLLRGLIFEGVQGIGKTSVAYLTAKALMCTGGDPEGCGKCPSCKTISEEGIDNHPDFEEVAGAMKAGVNDARDIMTTAESLPVLGKRRIVMIDEAHALSQDAWKVYLKPLELGNTNTIFMFVSNQGNKIPDEIRGRCCRPKFGRVDGDVILGFLANVASANHIQYELEALKAISRASKGIVREALGILNICAAIGTVTKQLVLDTMDDDLQDSALKIFGHIVNRDQHAAVAAADETCRTESPVRLIEALFIVYAKAVYRPELPEHQAIRTTFGDICGMTQIFLKWTTPQQLSSDIMPLLIVELMGINDIKIQKYTAGASRYNSAPEATEDSNVVSTNEFAELTGAKQTR